MIVYREISYPGLLSLMSVYVCVSRLLKPRQIPIPIVFYASWHVARALMLEVRTADVQQNAGQFTPALHCQ